MGSACRWAIFQPPSSRRHTVVVRSENGAISWEPPSFAAVRSISTTYAKFPSLYSEILWGAIIGTRR